MRRFSNGNFLANGSWHNRHQTHVAAPRIRAPHQLGWSRGRRARLARIPISNAANEGQFFFAWWPARPFARQNIALRIESQHGRSECANCSVTGRPSSKFLKRNGQGLNESDYSSSTFKTGFVRSSPARKLCAGLAVTFAIRVLKLGHLCERLPGPNLPEDPVENAVHAPVGP